MLISEDRSASLPEPLAHFLSIALQAIVRIGGGHTIAEHRRQGQLQKAERARGSHQNQAVEIAIAGSRMKPVGEATQESPCGFVADHALASAMLARAVPVMHGGQMPMRMRPVAFKRLNRAVRQFMYFASAKALLEHTGVRAVSRNDPSRACQFHRQMPPQRPMDRRRSKARR
jgi:hypothetical protein